MALYHYSLIRYVPDPDRMEPVNVGLVLQGDGGLDFRLNPHASKRKEIDTEQFRRWKDFFEAEIRGPHLPLFQPERESARFFRYLSDLCGGPVFLSNP